MAGRTSWGCFGKIVALAILIPAAIIAVLYFTSSQSPFASKPNEATISAPAPIMVGTITRQFKVITAQVTGQTQVEGETKNALPFSSEKFTYQVVMTVTAGIDMSRLKDTDVNSSGDTVTIHLPSPEILTKERNGWVISREQQVFSGPSSDKNIVDKMAAAGEEKILDGIQKDGKLFREARLNAEIELRNFILQLGYKQVKFTYDETSPTPAISPKPASTPSPVTSGPPR